MARTTSPQPGTPVCAELLELIDIERPKIVDMVHWAASNGDRSENGDYLYGKKRLREIDRRIRFSPNAWRLPRLSTRAASWRDQIYFGATVTYADDEGRGANVCIMGIDEAGLCQAGMSGISPIVAVPCSRRARAMVGGHT